MEELRQEATELGLTFPKNIGSEKLKEKIDAHYKSQETSGKELNEAVEATEQAEEKSPEKSTVKVGPAGSKINAAKAAANVTRIVTVIDNDQRVNNQTTTFKVNCSNAYFDLGQRIYPLGIEVEIRQGHLNVLKEVKIPQHYKDSRTNLSEVRMIPRYTLAYSDKVTK